ncbi:MAG: hypothetical protein WBS54_03665 [Acidobacteriota bacterium]
MYKIIRPSLPKLQGCGFGGSSAMLKGETFAGAHGTGATAARAAVAS